ncbi:hypothetical protein BDR26DRAFT_295371 [Obelidium mucronatum]|nr:hypothetical protein BDR26DRAFT_295371 [Obelidium mucronatum]
MQSENQETRMTVVDSSTRNPFHDHCDHSRSSYLESLCPNDGITSLRSPAPSSSVSNLPFRRVPAFEKEPPAVILPSPTPSSSISNNQIDRQPNSSSIQTKKKNATVLSPNRPKCPSPLRNEISLPSELATPHHFSAQPQLPLRVSNVVLEQEQGVIEDDDAIPLMYLTPKRAGSKSFSKKKTVSTISRSVCDSVTGTSETGTASFLILEDKLRERRKKVKCLLWSLCGVVFVLLGAVVGTILFWKLFLPGMMQSVFRDGNLTNSNQPLFGVKLVNVSQFTEEGLVLGSLVIVKSGFHVPFGASALVSEGSKWQLQAAMDSSTWHTFIEVSHFPSIIEIQHDAIMLNASDVQIFVTNSSLLTELVQLTSQYSGVQSTSTRDILDGVKLRLSIMADVTVAIFQVDGLLLENSFSLGDIVGYALATTVSPEPSRSSNLSATALQPPPLISSITTDKVVKIASGMISTGLNLHISNLDPSTEENLGSPIQFPAFQNITFLGEVGRKQVALLQISEMSMLLGEQVVHVPISVANVGGSNVGGLVGKGANLTSWLTSKLGSTVFSNGEISLVNFDVGRIGGGTVPLWLKQAISGVGIDIAAGSSGAFAALLGQALLAFL